MDRSRRRRRGNGHSNGSRLEWSANLPRIHIRVQSAGSARWSAGYSTRCSAGWSAGCSAGFSLGRDTRSVRQLLAREGGQNAVLGKSLPWPVPR